MCGRELFDMAGNVKQGLTAGVIVALVASVTAGVSSGSFWRFLAVLAFSMLCVGAAQHAGSRSPAPPASRPITDRISPASARHRHINAEAESCQPPAVPSGHEPPRHHHPGRAPATGGAQRRRQPAGAATELLINAVDGIWLVKLGGWPQYVQAFDGTRIPEGLWIDWGELRDDLAADEKARDEFTAWANSYIGRKADDDEYDRTHVEMVSRRPWHGASSSEMTVLRIALDLAPGGLLGDGLAHLDEANTSTILIAVAEVAEGRYIKPDWADV